jgi:hypothetical protein
MATRINFKDIYSIENELDVDIIALLLEEYDISCSIRNFGFGSMPSMKKPQEKRVSVEAADAISARGILEDAIRKGMISTDGKFVA